MYRILNRDDIGVQCVNETTLVPLCVEAAADGHLDAPVNIQRVDPAFIYVNSEGYAFDVRNLNVLLSVNFRNLNPHTAGDMDRARPIWVTDRDIAALLHHPVFSARVRAKVTARMALLNCLSHRTKVKLAEWAGELYSHSYQRFHDWLGAIDPSEFDACAKDRGLTSLATIMHQTQQAHRQKRQTTVASLRQHLAVQSAEHFCEPPCVYIGGDTYRMLAEYKGHLVRDMIEYMTDMADRNRRATLALRAHEATYKASRMARLLGLVRGTPRPCSVFNIMLVEMPERRRARAYLRKNRICMRPVPTTCRRTVVIRVDWRPETRQYIAVMGPCEIPIQNPRDMADLLDDMVSVANHFVLLSQLTAATCGFVRRQHGPGKGQRLIDSANRYLSTLAATWACCRGQSLVSHLINKMTVPLVTTTTPAQRTAAVLEELSRVGISDRYYRSVAAGIARDPNLEFAILNSIELQGGYDDVRGNMSLIDKLRMALVGRTCAQDIAGELCEYLSLPYPYRHPVFSQYQCDHTGPIPDIQSQSMTMD